MTVIDKNRELFITKIINENFKKLGNSLIISLAVMTESSLWNDDNELLAAITDGKFVVWYYPNVVFIDDDLITLTKFEKDGRYIT